MIEPRLLRRLQQVCSVESRRGQPLPVLRQRMRGFSAGIPDESDWDLPELAARALLALGFSVQGEPDLILPPRFGPSTLSFVRSSIPSRRLRS